MQSHTDILASLDHALADTDACKNATNLEPVKPAAAPENHGVEGQKADTRLVGIQHPSHSHPITTPSKPSLSPTSHLATYSSPTPSKQRQEATAKVRPSIARSWRKLWPHQKLARAFLAAEAQGGISFTLNLSPRLQATLSGSPDPARLQSHYINRELRKATDSAVPYAFTFEVSPAGRLHLHGVLVPGSFEEDYILAIDRALGNAGGKLKAANITRLTQSYLGTLPDALGWYAYIQKQGDRAAQFLGTNKVTFISASLRKMCA
ncbi:hypothetical protein [Mesorhizobium sp. RMAD-H1]|uniref:hypothetical protein n=1 Tax=Mesorhizobium sp. RMAD-H1 TaxID=2587065 RepID=UPI00161C9F8A|nr:hypothetical protein [Mesorhizobium sp. RMAD-H1]MBB2969808.1 hypothetical protein [Mesorhizobium sp. RMAD-H1]